MFIVSLLAEVTGLCCNTRRVKKKEKKQHSTTIIIIIFFFFFLQIVFLKQQPLLVRSPPSCFSTEANPNHNGRPNEGEKRKKTKNPVNFNGDMALRIQVRRDNFLLLSFCCYYYYCQAARPLYTHSTQLKRHASALCNLVRSIFKR